MVGPLSSTTRSRASTAACHSSMLFCLGKLLDIVGGVLEGDELATAGQGNGIVEGAGPGHSGQFVGAQALNLCQINVDQSDGRHSFVFFWIESVPIKLAACGMLDLRSEPIEIL
jgi:hypothetical protein